VPPRLETYTEARWFWGRWRLSGLQASPWRWLLVASAEFLRGALLRMLGSLTAFWPWREQQPGCACLWWQHPWRSGSLVAWLRACPLLSLEWWVCLYRQPSDVEARHPFRYSVTYTGVHAREVLRSVRQFACLRSMPIPRHLLGGLLHHQAKGLGPHAVWLTRNTASNLIHAARRVCFGFYYTCACRSGAAGPLHIRFFGATTLIHATTCRSIQILTSYLDSNQLRSDL
jgi:hypothetical protein